MGVRAQVKMLKSISLQALLVVIVALIVFLAGGALAARDVFVGGSACILPNLLFARMLNKSRGLEPSTFVLAFFLGEAVKLVLTLVLLMAIFKWLTPTHWALLLLGMVVALHAPLLGFFLRHERNETRQTNQSGDGQAVRRSA